MSRKIIQVRDNRDPVIIYFNIELDDAMLTPYEFRVYSRIVRLCSGTKNGRAEEPLDEMARACRMSRSQVGRCINALLTRKMIKTISRKGQTSAYSLTDKSKWISASKKKDPCLPDMGTHVSQTWVDPCLPDMGVMSTRHGSHVYQTWVPKKERPQTNENTATSGVARNLKRSRDLDINGSTTHVSFFHGENPRKNEQEKEKKKRVVKPQKTLLPDAFEITPEFLQFCRIETPAIDPQFSFNEFCDHARENAREAADWPAALRRWCRKAQSMISQQTGETNESHSGDINRGLELLKSRGSAN